MAVIRIGKEIIEIPDAPKAAEPEVVAPKAEEPEAPQEEKKPRRTRKSTKAKSEATEDEG